MLKIQKRILPILISIVCLLFVNVVAFAAEPLDTEQTGSISVTIKAYATDETVGGGSLYLYKIANVSGSEDAYVYTSEFAGCDEALLLSGEIEKADTANVFADWIKKADVSAISLANINTEGQAYFDNLSLGLYMVTQNSVADGYDAINPFLVSVPISEDGVWVYSVDATPKTSPVTKQSKVDGNKVNNGKKVDNNSDDGGSVIKTSDTGSDAGDNTKSSQDSASGAKTADSLPVMGLAIMISAAVSIIAVALRRTKNDIGGVRSSITHD